MRHSLTNSFERAMLGSAVCLALVATACGGTKLPDMAPASDFPAAGEPAKLVVKRAGEGARVLRLAPTAGTSDKVMTNATIDVDGGGGGQTISMGFDMSLGGVQSIVSVESNGTFHQRFVVDEPSVKVRGELANQLGEDGTAMMNGMLKGLTIGFDIDAQGRVLKMTSEGGAAAMMGQMQAGLNQAMQGGAVPFPSEAVGLGGEWSALAMVDMMGAKMRLSSTYKVLELVGDKAKLELSMAGGAENQPMSMPNVPASVELKAMALTAKGILTIDLTRPTAGLVDMEMAVEMDITAQGESAKMAMKFKINTAPR